MDALEWSRCSRPPPGPTGSCHNVPDKPAGLHTGHPCAADGDTQPSQAGDRTVEVCGSGDEEGPAASAAQELGPDLTPESKTLGLGPAQGIRQAHPWGCVRGPREH